MVRGYFAVCEGLDASGKTTAMSRALGLLGRDGFPVVYSKALKTGTPAGRLSRLYPSTLTLLTEVLYLDRTAVVPELEEGNSVLQDRWYGSVLCHNPPNRNDRLLERIYVPRMTSPDLLVNFSVSPDKRIERLLEREPSDDDLALLEDPGLIGQRERRYMERFDAFPGDKAMLDTTDLSEEEGGQELYRMIRPRLERHYGKNPLY